jgi:hypothetical protein
MRHIVKFRALLVLILGSTLTAQNPSPWGRYSGPSSLGFYNLDRDTSLKSLLDHFGAKPAGRDTYCFADARRGLYLYARPMDDQSGRVAEVLLSSFPNCKGISINSTTIEPAIWRTPEGIGIGSTKDDVVRAYHKPVYVKKLEPKNDLGVIAGIKSAGASGISVGDFSYLYSCLLNVKEGCTDDGRAAQMGFRGGKLIWIRVSNSE